MKKVLMGVCLFSCVWLFSCSNNKNGSTNGANNSGNAASTDSSTTNPINSEYGTPNASENSVDSAQSVHQDSTKK